MPLDEVFDRSWQAQGACVGVSPTVANWFPDHGQAKAAATGQAIVICRSCPVLAECLRWALVTGEREGILGGLTPKLRAKLRREMVEDGRLEPLRRCDNCGSSYPASWNTGKGYCSERCVREGRRIAERRLREGR